MADSVVCFSNHTCFYCIGAVFEIIVTLTNEAVSSQIFSRWYSMMDQNLHSQFSLEK